MSEHCAAIRWTLDGDSFAYEDYSRDHTWTFEDTFEVAASASPVFHGTVGRVDPEEAFVAALSSCHMLTFLGVAARKRIKVLEYSDDATGYLERLSGVRLHVPGGAQAAGATHRSRGPHHTSEDA